MADLDMKTKKKVTKRQALKIAMDHLVSCVRKIELQADDDPRNFPTNYRLGTVPEPCWCIQVPSAIPVFGMADQIGASCFILVSKVRGEILFSGRAGE
jgi:hypothetical protein